MNAEKPLTLTFSSRADGLRADVAGDATFDNTIAYWREIVDEVKRCRPKTLLLVDRMQGDALSAEQWKQLVDAMHGHGLEKVRIAHVKPEGLEQLEYCEMFALEAGFKARVFYDETQADLWLRHGGF